MKTDQFFELLQKSDVQGVIEMVDSAAGDPFIRVEPGDICPILTFLRDDGECLLDQLSLLSGVHYEDRFECVYHLLSTRLMHDLVVKVHLDATEPRVPSVCAIHPTANWHERETFDLVGIVFDGHPDPRRIYLPDDWVGHPLRKDYQYPEEYNGFPLLDQHDPEKQPETETAEAGSEENKSE